MWSEQFRPRGSSGRYDLRNTKIEQGDNWEKIIVTTAEGTKRHYKAQSGYGNKRHYRLEKEVLLNGKILCFEYINGKLVKIKSCDPSEQHTYSTIAIKYEGNTVRFITNTGQTALARKESRMFSRKLKTKEGKKIILENYPAPPLLATMDSPFDHFEKMEYNKRFLLNSYSRWHNLFNCIYEKYSRDNLEPHYRIYKLCLPVGIKDAWHPIYDFDYVPTIPGKKEGFTTVRNNDGTKIIYRFSKNLLTTMIQTFAPDGQLKKEKKFHWNADNRLESIELSDGNKQLLYKKSYLYDQFGNPIQETMTGDLYGTGLQISHTIKREFSQEGRHLLLKEEDEEGATDLFTYVPNTNLILSKFTKDKDQVLKREFFEYDNCFNLTKKIVDDGISDDKDNLFRVTQRNITNYILRQEQPFLHMPEVIEEKYLSGKNEVLLKKRILSYDPYGNVCREDHYDANNDFAYTIFKEYDESGNLLSETNATQQKAIYSYIKGNCTFSSNFSGRLKKHMFYDLRGRLKEEKEIGDDGIIHQTHYEYDLNDHLIKKIDPFGNSTTYKYDPIANKPISIETTPVITSNGLEKVVTFSTYDSFGREISKTDANENTTLFRYNAYGSPKEITYPDGSNEHFSFTKKGWLKSHFGRDRLLKVYSHDALGRVISKKYYFEGANIGDELFTYGTFNLLQETDKNGNLHQYEYDGAGRKIREEFCGRVTEITYDSLGRLETITKENGENTLITRFKRDLLNRITKKSKCDISGKTLQKISYTYDLDGNRSSLIHRVGEETAEELFLFDSFKRLIQKKDALGYQTIISYNEKYIHQGQQVLQKRTKNPNNTTLIEIFNPYGKIAKKEMQNGKGSVISCEEFLYDTQGNPIEHKTDPYCNGIKQATQLLKYRYNNQNRVSDYTRAFGTTNARTTSFTYTSEGKVASKTLPDQTILNFDYNGFGFLRSLTSSDNQIKQKFTYDRLGAMLTADDEVQKVSINRKVDPFGNVLQEIISNNLEVNNTYDHFDRLTSMSIKGEGEIAYECDPLFLRSVTRLSPTGEKLYSHTYNHYDKGGHLFSETLINDLGEINYSYDLAGRKFSIESSFFSEHYRYDSMGNLITKNTNQCRKKYGYDELSQIVLEEDNDLTSTYEYDSCFNRKKKNGKEIDLNPLNELISQETINCKYDLNGNLIKKQKPTEMIQFKYDPLNRLIEVLKNGKRYTLTYDALGRCVSKNDESVEENYIYQGSHEIGIYSESEIKQLRVLGHEKKAIAIELNGKVFAPIFDIQGNVRALINKSTKQLERNFEYSSFGENLNGDNFIPWGYASKRFHPEFGLINFGKRFYDPQLGRWTSIDPDGFVDSVNLYQYLYNNPYRYYDPDGRFIFAIPLFTYIIGGTIALPSFTTIACVAATAAAAWTGYKFSEALNQSRSENKLLHNLDNFCEDTLTKIDKGGVDPTLPENLRLMIRNGKT